MCGPVQCEWHGTGNVSCGLGQHQSNNVVKVGRMHSKAQGHVLILKGGGKGARAKESAQRWSHRVGLLGVQMRLNTSLPNLPGRLLRACPPHS